MVIALAFLVGIVFGRSSAPGQQEVAEKQSTEVTKVGQSETPSKTERQAQEKTQTGERVSASGRGSDALTVDLTPGSVTWNYSYQDEGQFPGYFAIDLLDVQGRPLALIANHVGTASGAKTVNIPQQGTYYINVTANSGSWTLEGPPVVAP